MSAAARYATPRTLERRSYGPAVGKLGALLGRPLTPWQQQVNDVALEVEADGSWAYRTIICTVQRQAGKTTLLAPLAVHRCLTRPGVRTWLTAQSRQDARDTWTDVATLVKGSPLSSYVERRRSNGSEALTMPNGSTFRVFAPSEDALHGKANELVAVDEVWAFDGDQGAALEQAILPTFTTTGGQLWLVSTAGHAGSEWLRRYVDLGRAAVIAGKRERIAYFEWSLDDAAAELVELDLSSEDPVRRARAFDLLLEAHPGHGHYLRRDAVEQAAESMTPGDFLRAYGNRWSKATERVIPLEAWNTCQSRGEWPAPAVPVALAFDVALDRSAAAIVAAWRDTPTGPLRLDVVEARPGTAWLLERVVELAEAWKPLAIGHDTRGPSLDVADALTRRGVKLLGTTTHDYATACAAFLAGVVDDGRLEIRPDADLDAAVDAAAQRPLGDAWAWSRRQAAGSIAPLVAATLAGWAYDHRPAAAIRPVVRVRRPATTSRGRVA